MKLYQLFLITLLFFTYTTKTMAFSLQHIHKLYEESKNDQSNQYDSWVLFYLLEMRFNQDIICVANDNVNNILSYLFMKHIQPPFPDRISSEQGSKAKRQAISYIKNKILPPAENLITFVEAVFNTTLNAPFIDSSSRFPMQEKVIKQYKNSRTVKNSQQFVIPKNTSYFFENCSQKVITLVNSTN